MSIDDVTAIASDALFLVIQEQTLTFVPKILAVFLSIIVLGNWMLTQITEFMNRLWSNFSLYTR